MNIALENVGKKYRYEWIFKGLSFQFQASGKYAILGPNGSGKSTFLKILSGHLSPSSGKIIFTKRNKSLDINAVYKEISYAAPYIELIEEFTLLEILRFQQKFKPYHPTATPDFIIELLGFEKSRHKEIRFFSSGMKQRLKLALALCADVPVILLDEPTTNLDREGIGWYKNMVNRFGGERLIVVVSNVEEDFEFCTEKISITDWKK
ncbi:MAG TPA: ABC transporter ATP-binding protein [Saprospiraceae bacterium]|nr:ABC transporter ATP-binding protein [Saprospiraceae bacterium]